MSEEKKVFSLADFAVQDTSDVAVVMSRLPAEGVFYCRGEAVEVTEMAARNPDEDSLLRISWKHVIIAALSLVKDDIDPDSMENRTVYEQYPLWPDSFNEALGLVKGNYKRIGLATDGAPGGVEGHPEGWLNGFEGALYKLRVRHATTKDGQERAYFDWRRLEDDEYERFGVDNPFASAE